MQQPEIHGFGQVGLAMNRNRDLFPSFKTTTDPICYHHLTKPAKGASAICRRCGKTFRAVRKRPERSPATTCHSCGHTTPRGPKHPKLWLWEEVSP